MELAHAARKSEIRSKKDSEITPLAAAEKLQISHTFSGKPKWFATSTKIGVLDLPVSSYNFTRMSFGEILETYLNEKPTKNLQKFIENQEKVKTFT